MDLFITILNLLVCFTCITHRPLKGGHIHKDSKNINTSQPMSFWYLSHQRNVILQTCVHSYLVGPGIQILVWAYLYYHTLCRRAVKVLTRLRRCAVPSEPSLLAHAISTKIPWHGSYIFIDSIYDS